MFNTSINIQMDLNSKSKINSYIETKSSKPIIEYLKNSIVNLDNNRANLLIAPYGTGKSYLVLKFLQSIKSDSLIVIVNGDGSLKEQFEKSEQEALKNAPKNYRRIFYIYDEFSKYLESTISQSTNNDMKFLQDLAEEVNRNNTIEKHLLLMLHKKLTNYIEAGLPKNKIDGWMGISGRFKELTLYNTTANLTELIIKFNPKIYRESALILAKLSEIIGQNERSIFTYCKTAKTFLPDEIYDYFATDFTNRDGHKNIIESIDDEFAIKEIKTIFLVNYINSYEFIKPTGKLIKKLYGKYSTNKNIIEKIDGTLQVIRHNYARNLAQEIDKEIKLSKLNTAELLDIVNPVKVIYPKAYNFENSITMFYRVFFGNKPNEQADGYKKLKIELYTGTKKILKKLYAVTKLMSIEQKNSVDYNELKIIFDDLSKYVLSNLKIPVKNIEQELSNELKIKYPNPLIVNYELINKNNLSPTMKKTCAQVIDYFLSKSTNYPQNWNNQQKVVVKVINNVKYKIKFSNNKSFKDIYTELLNKGVRKPAITLLIGKNWMPDITIFSNNDEVVIDSSTFNKIENNPENYTIKQINQTNSKFEDLFNEFISLGDKNTYPSTYIYKAIQKWYITLPPITKNLSTKFQNFIEQIQNNKLPKNIAIIKKYYDGFFLNFIKNKNINTEEAYQKTGLPVENWNKEQLSIYEKHDLFNGDLSTTGKLLYNDLTNTIAEYSTAITPKEKKYIVDLLSKEVIKIKKEV